MMLLWIDEGGEPAPPSFEFPNVLRTHPAMKGVDFQAQIRRGLRLQHRSLNEAGSCSPHICPTDLPF